MHTELIERIEERGAIMPDLVAVRLHGVPVTYRQLADDIMARVVVPDYTTEDAGVALFSALMSRLPYRLRTAAPVEDVRVVSAAIEWLLSYHLPTYAERRLTVTG